MGSAHGGAGVLNASASRVARLALRTRSKNEPLAPRSPM
jgi:hypothetical protein